MTGLLHLHSTLRWVALILLVVTVVGALRGGQSFTEGARKRGLFTMIALHLQLVFGFVLYFAGNNGVALFQQANVMKDSVLRFFAVEHMMGMVVGIVLGTLGHSLVKRANGDQAKYRKQALFFGLALLVIVASIPWPFRPGFEAHRWF
jgi:ABC-type antimicrobial peptide transport system permease subunit